MFSYNFLLYLREWLQLKLHCCQLKCACEWIVICRWFLFITPSAQFDQDPAIDFYVWNTVPGCILLAVRFGVAFWFLAILRRRQLDVNAGISDDDLFAPDYLGPGIDLVHFAAGFLLWMFVLPLVVFVAETSVSSLWRYKTIISIRLSADYVAACVYAYLLFRCCKFIHAQPNV
ncbi:hypothetical protein AHF37_11820 [Paragonimus kellicotti]|nr:hypothetical protein AHF37_11820 [Paragonimus kellicotti]